MVKSTITNGEIYNHREIRKQLEDSGITFRGHSDTEVLLRLLEKEGLEALPRLNGIFSFALIDRETGCLTLVRDHFGVKPVYYASLPSGFYFCSEIKGLIKLDIDVSKIDPASIDRYFSYLWCPGAGTPAINIRMLGPGEAITVSSGKITRHWRWYASPALRPKATTSDQDEAIRLTEKHLRTAVHRQMVADVPVGAFLSGGLDSSSVVAFAREINPEISCFSIEVPGGQERGFVDDLPYARRAADHLGVPLDVVQIDSKTMAHDLEKLVYQLDEPLADPASLNVLYISQLARSRGIKVLLSGAGGDDLFTGYRRHRAIQADPYWRWLPKPLLAASEKASAKLNQRHPLFRRIAKLLDGAALSRDDRLVNYLAWTKRSDLQAFYTPDFLAQLEGVRTAEPFHEYLAEMDQNSAAIDRMLALEQRFFLTDHNLVYTDKMSMAAGVEVRVPFLDIDLVEFAATIPHRFKQKGAEGKWILKKAMEPHLPHDLIYRPKSGFGAPLRHWIRNELREFFADVLSEDKLRNRGIFDPAAIRQLMDDNIAGKRDGSYTLLSVLCIELWCQRFLTAEPKTQTV
ncbi:asparagine synthase (glutamine-hydrolyzing) [Rhodobacteraceae bacterium R_SAG10]|nr:asparagine synthase (glutamine-hydrolyzing) [Rhodobacteraceae bacterium R_SAG10]